MSNSLKYQKIIKVGNSLGVTLDRDFVTKTGIQAGDQMAVSYDADEKVVSFAAADSSMATTLGDKPMSQHEYETFKKSKLASKITPELEAWVEKFLEENKEAMDKLANL